ncbi:DNA polymerase III subunit alpha [Sinomicrobium pectinilyticum]|uniref:DNA polymerase III subunit alpha n=1 Tax=Sinomicrobium pectinilyticum TaxID=1084421 RepID=A0A3N0EQX0_SINP1|nr:DNA polymerase III subunit alpha [Sinomicrobium pectinilyticum]RNL90315.1 DNA polymerase III subunit alpha [Sinomicrobium pectinilyticum]
MYLNCHTYYSLRFGTFSELDLLRLAQENGIGSFVLTDINNTSACLNFVRKAPGFGVRPLLGIDFRNGAEQQYVGIARNNQGYKNLNDLLSEHLHHKRNFQERAPQLPDACFVYPFEKVLLLGLKDLQEHEYIGISIADLRRLPFSGYLKYRDKLVVMQPVTFRDKRDFNAHRLLRAIDNNTLLSKLSPEEVASEQEKMFPLNELCAAFRDFDFIVENTRQLLDGCDIHFDFAPNAESQNQQTYLGNRDDDYKKIRELCLANLSYRYPGDSSLALERMEKELGLIRQMNFISYFLINWDIVTYARSRGYFHVGRGSGANSIVAYLLGITDVDPLELDLYFERFLNLFRSSPPDFDIDFSWRDREDMTRYIFERFPHVALMGTYVTFNYKGVVRELGKVFGLPKEDIDRLSEGGFNIEELDKPSQLVLRYGSLIDGFPNYVSVHASGIVIAERPLQHFSATFLPPKGFPTVQFDMHIAEDVGLYKFDILAQRGLAKIRETLDIIRYNQPEKELWDIHDIPRLKRDKKINALLRTAACMGCFYIESPAMRMLMKKLEVDNYLGLVAASSVIRPGVAQSGMMREYILRHRDPSRIKQAHPVLLEIMPDTYGVMVYQEDVIKVAHHFAGLSLAEADVLRRGMSGKFRSRAEFQAVEEKFIANCQKKGYEDKVTLEVWKQIESFAGYAFAKGHSASYAVESYQSLYLKTYFPLEYMVAVLNNGGGFYGPEIYLHETRMLGANIHLPCANRSRMDNVIYGKDLYLGLGYLKDLEDRAGERILREREIGGVFASLDDFMDRVAISIEQLSILIRIGAFRFTGVDKYELLWKAHFTLGHLQRLEAQQRLFAGHKSSYTIPTLRTTALEAAFDQIELLGFCLCPPFLLLLNPVENSRVARDFSSRLHRYVDIYGYLVTVKRSRTVKGDQMFFATFLDQEGEVFDAVLFPQVAQKYAFRGKGVYRIYAKVVEEFGYLSLEALKIRKEAYIQDPRFAE